MELQVKEVRFNGERITAIRESGKIYVSVKQFGNEYKAI